MWICECESILPFRTSACLFLYKVISPRDIPISRSGFMICERKSYIKASCPNKACCVNQHLAAQRWKSTPLRPAVMATSYATRRTPMPHSLKPFWPQLSSIIAATWTLRISPSRAVIPRCSLAQRVMDTPWASEVQVTREYDIHSTRIYGLLY